MSGEQKHRREKTCISIRAQSIQFAVTTEWPLQRFICSTCSAEHQRNKTTCLRSIELLQMSLLLYLAVCVTAHQIERDILETERMYNALLDTLSVNHINVN
jgi:hypothetical protein